jgi:hypothetical protein
MSFNDDITDDILKLVREELTALGYFVSLSGSGREQMITVEW